MKIIQSLVIVALLLLGTSFTQTARVSVRKPANATALAAGVFQGTQHQVTLSWTASTTSGVQYNVYRGTATGNETKYVTGITTTSYVDTGVVAGTYFYYVTAFVGTSESSGSNEVNAIVPANPAPPTGLVATAQ